jgi:hypothetical protein
VTAEQALEAAAQVCRERSAAWAAMGNYKDAKAAHYLAEAIARLDLSPASASSANLRPDGAGAGNCGEEEKR